MSILQRARAYVQESFLHGLIGGAVVLIALGFTIYCAFDEKAWWSLAGLVLKGEPPDDVGATWLLMLAAFAAGCIVASAEVRRAVLGMPDYVSDVRGHLVSLVLFLLAIWLNHGFNSWSEFLSALPSGCLVVCLTLMFVQLPMEYKKRLRLAQIKKRRRDEASPEEKERQAWRDQQVRDLEQ